MIWRVPALILIGLASGVAGLWVADREPPTVGIRDRELLTPIVAQGGDLMVRFHLQRRKTCEVSIERVLFDSVGIRYVLDTQTFRAVPAPPGPESYIAKIPIPADVRAGNAKYRSVSVYICNPIHRFFWPIMSSVTEVPFRVVERGSPDAQPPILKQVSP